jgi:hypothetical protein
MQYIRYMVLSHPYFQFRAMERGVQGPRDYLCHFVMNYGFRISAIQGEFLTEANEIGVCRPITEI